VRGAPVDIGDMSREWKPSEADVNDFLYSCLEPGDPERSAIQIDVAIDDLTVAVQEGAGAASKCIQILGGLNIDQLRWIYSDHTDVKLEETGWDPKSLKNSDSNSQTHLWNELDASCDPIEIRIAGADDLSGTFEYFKATMFRNDETFDYARPGFGCTNSEDDEELVSYLQEFGEAISYFGCACYYANQKSISAVPI
jgi:ABC-type phosphate transport system substrate-binding protein